MNGKTCQLTSSNLDNIDMLFAFEILISEEILHILAVEDTHLEYSVYQ